MLRGIVLALVLAACGQTPASSPSPEPTATASAAPTSSPSAAPTPSGHDITVILDLGDPGAWSDQQLECEGKGGYGDINAAAQVVIRDGNGAILATTNLGTGLHFLADTCSFIVKIKDVPTSAFYSVEISHRGELVYSTADIETKRWSVHTHLGQVSPSP